MRISLFVPCFIDQIYPNIAIQTVRLLWTLGVEVDYPKQQTCCGQPAFNTGYWREATALAKHFIDVFSGRGENLIVSPSGSCISMITRFYQELPLPASYQQRLKLLVPRCMELSDYLANVIGERVIHGTWHQRAAYHHSCHLLRELGLKDEPFRLLQRVNGLDLVPWQDSAVCCGFGGTFSVKFPALSCAMTEEKLRSLQPLNVSYIIANDASCLMQFDGLLRRRNSKIQVLHVVEVLARAMGIKEEL